MTTTPPAPGPRIVVPRIALGPIRFHTQAAADGMQVYARAMATTIVQAHDLHSIFGTMRWCRCHACQWNQPSPLHAGMVTWPTRRTRHRRKAHR